MNGAFGNHSLPQIRLRINPGFSSTPLRAFIGRVFNTTTGSSATSHPHQAWLSPCLNASSKEGWIRCQASSVTAPVPVRNATLKHTMGLTEYGASRYFAHLPTHLAESGSLSLCISNFLWVKRSLRSLSPSAHVSLRSVPSDPIVGQ